MAPDKLPGIHEYVMAPLAVKVAVPPEQIVALLTVTVVVGITVMVRVALEVHVPLEPIIV